jgi:hypothetical protein
MSLKNDRKDPYLPNPAQILLDLAEDYLRVDDVSTARQICQAALSLSQSLFGGNSASTNKAMSRLAELYFLAEDYSNSESTYLDLMKMQSNLNELDDPALDNCLSLLAEFYDFRWNHSQAELFYTWLLRVREKSGNEERIAETRTRLAENARRSKQLSQAETRELAAVADG